MEPKIILHGGIEFTEGKSEEKKEKALDTICCAAYGRLMESNALDAVESAITMLEDNPFFNAGTGAILQADGVQRMDASIMDGYSYRSGAVSQIRGVRNPIKVARLVMEKTSHHLIVGDEAQKFAYLNGIEMHATMTKEAVEKWLKIRNDVQYGTVGAVAIDKEGKIAAATSTGGWATSFPGRVGDVPIIGAGTYSNNYVGVSCTGHGEKILTINLARLVSFYVGEGYELERAAEKSLGELRKIDGIGGFIAVNFNGDLLSIATHGAYMPVSSMPQPQKPRYL